MPSPFDEKLQEKAGQVVDKLVGDLYREWRNGAGRRVPPADREIARLAFEAGVIAGLHHMLTRNQSPKPS